jgi:hypothetical protein
MTRILSLLLFLSCCLPGVVSARLIATPTYQNLYDRADVVVIATPQVTTDTDEHIALPGLQPDVPAIGVDTPLRVQAWLKGKPVETPVLHHYRLANPGQPLVNGPLLLDFHRDDAQTLLFFLVRESDGHYALVAGQTDPAGFSVFRIDRGL